MSASSRPLSTSTPSRMKQQHIVAFLAKKRANGEADGAATGEGPFAKQARMDGTPGSKAPPPLESKTATVVDEIDLTQTSDETTDLDLSGIEAIAGENGTADKKAEPAEEMEQDRAGKDGATEDAEEFEVEKILDYSWCRATNRGLYRIKWAGWDREEDLTWEPGEHLDGATEKLKDFFYTRLAEREAAKPHQKRFLEVPPDPRTHFERRSELADQILPPPCLSTLEKFFSANKSRSLKAWPDHVFNATLDKLFKSKAPNRERKEKVQQQLMIRYLKENRRAQLERLKEWEAEINSIEDPAIVVENNADLEGPPRHMTYITKYKPSSGIVIPDDPPFGCSCENECSSSAGECCPDTNEASFAYNKFGRLRLEVGRPIFECNKRCTCHPDKCYNRVVQRGRKVKLCIYRTDNGCGWGVKALEKIKKGQFVVEYVGEVITSEEAEERGKVYDAEGRTYLFDLDFNRGAENPYTVDAANYGNVSHFINHSCDPNLSIYNVWIDCLDPDLPRLALFARKDIAKGDPISFDYCRQTINAFDVRDYVDGESLQSDEDGNIDMDVLNSSLGIPSSTDQDNRSKMECRCGAANCRKVLFDV